MNNYLDIALNEAKKSLKTDDVPIGAVIVEKGIIISKAHNEREKKHSVTRHAEIISVEKACKKKKTWHLSECEIYVTLEPCPMCMEVLKQARIKKIYYAAPQEKQINYKNIEKIQLKNVENSRKIIKDFFKNKRK